MGIIVTFVKLRGDRDSAAITQAAGANEALVAALRAVEHERDYWRSRYSELERENADLRSRLAAT